MSDEIHIRPFAPDDAPAAVDIYNQARPIEVARLTEDRLWSWFSDPALDATRDILVAADAEGPVGLIASFPWPHHLALGSVFFVGPSVLPEFQSRGVGKLLVQALAERVAAQHPGVRLQTRLHQTNARGHGYLTGRLGFEVERQFWQMSHGALGKVQPGAVPAGYEVAYLRPREDTSEAVALYQQILDDPAAGRHLLGPDELANWASLGKFADDSFQVARRGGRIVGLCFQSFPPGADYGQVEFLGVLPSERGRGVATHMLKRALATAHGLGKVTVRMEVTDAGNPDLALYKKLGFEVTGGEVFYQRPTRDLIEA